MIILVLRKAGTSAGADADAASAVELLGCCESASVKLSAKQTSFCVLVNFFGLYGLANI